ncbi:class B sortase [Adlercreutzia sp. ZJ473]|uniref:class B sortase n=1 Tax=Adlercreutzia sp. ZJ473 TaxID=2722822 RepID=UPI0020A68272|nr:class B sortase [Adlercreutzia sp. ZJ473]
MTQNDNMRNVGAKSPAGKPGKVATSDDFSPRHMKKGPALGKKRSITVLAVVLVVLIVGVLACVGYMAWQKSELDRSAQEINAQPVPETPAQTTSTDDRMENPIDFASLKVENPDIYAWIYIPNTNINLPVLQHLTDDNFYLDHNVNGDYAVEGAIYSQSLNATDFSDPVTLLYGHNLLNNTMFTQLHYFENADFFNENELMYLYTPGHILTYRIISAYQYDDRHILNSFNFSDPAVTQSYFDYVANPDALICNVRPDVKLDASTDKIVQLSTCVSGSSSSNRRYIVSGVLTDDQATF